MGDRLGIPGAVGFFLLGPSSFLSPFGLLPWPLAATAGRPAQGGCLQTLPERLSPWPPDPWPPQPQHRGPLAPKGRPAARAGGHNAAFPPPRHKAHPRLRRDCGGCWQGGAILEGAQGPDAGEGVRTGVRTSAVHAGRGQGAGLWEEGGGGGGRGGGGGVVWGRKPEGGAGLLPGLGLLRRASASEALGPSPGPGPWALFPLARPPGCPQLPSQPAAAPPPSLPAPRPETWAPPTPTATPATTTSLLGTWAPLRPEGHSLPSHRQPPLCPWGSAPGLRCPGRQKADRPGLPAAPWAPGSTLRLKGAAKATARLSRSARPAAPHTGPREVPGHPTPHPPPQRTRPEKETLAGPQA